MFVIKIMPIGCLQIAHTIVQLSCIQGQKYPLAPLFSIRTWTKGAQVVAWWQVIPQNRAQEFMKEQGCCKRIPTSYPHCQPAPICCIRRSFCCGADRSYGLLYSLIEICRGFCVAARRVALSLVNTEASWTFWLLKNPAGACTSVPLPCKLLEWSAGTCSGTRLHSRTQPWFTGTYINSWYGPGESRTVGRYASDL